MKKVRRSTAKGNALSRQRGSGHLAGLGRFRTLSRADCAIKVRPMPAGKLYLRGVHMSRHLSFIIYRKAAGVKARVRTVPGKSGCTGSQGGLRKHGYG